MGGSAPSASSGSRHPEASQALPAADGKRGAPVTCFQLSGGRFLLAASQALHPPPTQTYVLPPEPQMKPYDPLTSDTQPCQGPPQTRGQRVERRSLLLCRLPQASLPAEGEAQRSQGVYTQPAVYTTARGPSHPPPRRRFNSSGTIYTLPMAASAQSPELNTCNRDPLAHKAKTEFKPGSADKSPVPVRGVQSGSRNCWVNAEEQGHSQSPPVRSSRNFPLCLRCLRPGP